LSGALTISNRQKKARVNTRQLRWITLRALEELLAPGPEVRNSKFEIRNSSVDLGVYVVDAMEMTRLNEIFLHHAGSTDVITFDYCEYAPAPLRRGNPRAARHGALQGEIFICLEEARIQARRFRTSWPAELVRYVVHGILHLLGYDDRRAAARRRMKREEERLVKLLQRSFDFRAVAGD